MTHPGVGCSEREGPTLVAEEAVEIPDGVHRHAGLERDFRRVRDR